MPQAKARPAEREVGVDQYQQYKKLHDTSQQMAAKL